MNAMTRPSAPDFETARYNMIESQIRPNKVRHEPLLEAMGNLPREIFVPAPLAGIAYIDEEIQVATGRYLLEPMVLARLLQAADVKPTDRVLDVAPATGYSTAVLAAIAKNVVALESDATLGQQCAQNIDRLQIKNASVQPGAFAEGAKTGAPFDVIIVNGSSEILPDALTSQLEEGGRLLIIMREFGPAQIAHKGEARMYEKIRGNLSYRALFDANVKVLPGLGAKPAFSF